MHTPQFIVKCNQISFTNAANVMVMYLLHGNYVLLLYYTHVTIFWSHKCFSAYTINFSTEIKLIHFFLISYCVVCAHFLVALAKINTQTRRMLLNCDCMVVSALHLRRTKKNYKLLSPHCVLLNIFLIDRIVIKLNKENMKQKICSNIYFMKESNAEME